MNPSRTPGLGRAVTVGLISLVALPALLAAAGVFASRHLEREVRELVESHMMDMRSTLQLRMLLEERTNAIRALRLTGDPEHIAAHASAAGQFAVRLEYLRRRDPAGEDLYHDIEAADVRLRDAAKKLLPKPGSFNDVAYASVLRERALVDEAFLALMEHQNKRIEQAQAEVTDVEEAIQHVYLVLASIAVLIGLIVVRTTTRKLEEAFAAERAAVRARDEVLAFVSHDLKTPLASVLFSAELAQKKQPSPSRELDLIRKNAWRMNALIKDLLDVARVTDGSLSVSPARCSLSAIIGDVVEEVTAEAQKRSVTIDVSQGKLPDVLVDGDRLRQVLENLLGNAVKHGVEGGRVKVDATSTADGFARVAVSDDGPGVPVDEREAIFEPYRQGSRHSKGAGLGLAIARGIVAAHGGRLWVEDGIAGGACFVFTVPLAPTRADAPAITAAA